jgi:hypothetical protein
VLVELPVAQRVAVSGGDLEDLGFLRTPDSGSQGSVHDMVHGDDIYEAIGVTGELPDDALGEGHDNGIGHPGTLNPTGVRLSVAALDNGRSYYDERRLPPLPHDHALGERLGEGVDVVPA